MGSLAPVRPHRVVIVGGGFADERSTGTAGETRTSTPVSDSDDRPAEAGSVEQVATSVLPSVVKINVALSDLPEFVSRPGKGIQGDSVVVFW